MLEILINVLTVEKAYDSRDINCISAMTCRLLMFATLAHRRLQKWQLRLIS